MVVKAIFEPLISRQTNHLLIVWRIDDRYKSNRISGVFSERRSLLTGREDAVFSQLTTEGTCRKTEKKF